MTRRIKPNHRSITGSLPTRFAARQHQYESKLERDFLILLEIDVGLKEVVTQPMTIDLVVDGKHRSYTPDILACWWDGFEWTYGAQTVVFEVKPYKVLKEDYANLAPKYRAAKRHFRSLNLDFRVITDRSIYSPRQANAVLLAPAMQRPVSLANMEFVEEIMDVEEEKIQTFGEVRDLLMQRGLFRDVARDVLYHHMAGGLLLADLDVPLTDSTPVRWWSTVAAEEIDRCFPQEP